MELRDVMTPDPTICRSDATARDAATLMRDQDIGDVLVQDEADRSASSPIGTSSPAPSPPAVTRRMFGSARSARPNVKTVSVDTPVDEVIRVMSDTAVRRIPVTAMATSRSASSPSAILAIDRDRSSLLGDISAAPPNN